MFGMWLGVGGLAAAIGAMLTVAMRWLAWCLLGERQRRVHRIGVIALLAWYFVGGNCVAQNVYRVLYPSACRAR